MNCEKNMGNATRDVKDKRIKGISELVKLTVHHVFALHIHTYFKHTIVI